MRRSIDMARDPHAPIAPGSRNVADELKAAKARIRLVWIVGFAVYLASILFLVVSAPAPWMGEYSVPLSVIPAGIAVYVTMTILGQKTSK
jgi:hypothetical protein